MPKKRKKQFVMPYQKVFIPHIPANSSLQISLRLFYVCGYVKCKCVDVYKIILSLFTWRRVFVKQCLCCRTILITCFQGYNLPGAVIKRRKAMQPVRWKGCWHGNVDEGLRKQLHQFQSKFSMLVCSLYNSNDED